MSVISGEGEMVLGRAVDAGRERFGSRLLSAYAIGSLAHGGFAPLVSDVDLVLVIGDPLSDADGETIDDLSAAVRSSGGLAGRLSVFWASPAIMRGERAGGRLPALDTLDLLQYGRLLHGLDTRDGAATPPHAALVTQAAALAVSRLGGGGLAGAGAGGWGGGRGRAQVWRL
ncbi:hypothetical protein I6A81_00705, partial [Frankia sp. CN7]